jgi:ABC-type transporter Mla subunit MlaD
MVSKLLPWALLAVVFGAGAWLYDRTSDELRELRERETVLVDSLADQSREVAESEREVARTDSIAADSIARLGEQIDDAVRAAQGASSRLRDILGENGAALAELDAIEAAHAVERDAFGRREAMYLAQIASRDNLLARMRTQSATKDALIVNLRGQIDELDPPFFVGLFRDLPKLAAAAAVGALIIQ